MDDPEPKKVRICIKVEQHPNDSKTSLHCLKWIQAQEDDTIIFEFPPQYQLLHANHKCLLQVPTVRNVLKSLSKRGSYRIVSMTLPAETVPLYFDGEGNVVFEEYFLQEKDYQTWRSDMSPPPQTASDAPSAAVLDILQKLTTRAEDPQRVINSKRLNLTKIKSDFVLDNFDGRNSEVGRWLDTFIRECERCQVNDSENKVLILRLFMDGIAKNWYSSTLIELGLEKDFTDWELKMRTEFKEQGWRKIREAYNYRYIGGHYDDYVLRKQCLLLEQEHAIDNIIQLNLIVMGLPVNVQEKLDRSKINSIAELLGELRKIELSSLSPQKKSANIVTQIKNPIVTTENKKPCSICNNLGYRGRFHPEAVCRNRLASEKQEKGIKTVNNAEVQETLNESITDKKKLGLLPLITFGVIINRNKNCTGIYDPGANISFITLKCVKNLKLRIQDNNMTFRTIGGRHGFAGCVNVKLRVMNLERDVQMFIVNDENFKYDVLLGLDLIVSFYLNLNCKLHLYQTLPEELKKDNDENFVQKLDGLRDVYVNYNEGIDVNNFEAKVDHLDSTKRREIENLIHKFNCIFAKDKFDVGRVNDHEAHIQLFEHKFVSRKPYRCSIPDQQEIENQISQLLKADLIEESTSPFASSVTLAYKRDHYRERDRDRDRERSDRRTTRDDERRRRGGAERENDERWDEDRKRRDDRRREDDRRYSRRGEDRRRGGGDDDRIRGDEKKRNGTERKNFSEKESSRRNENSSDLKEDKNKDSKTSTNSLDNKEDINKKESSKNNREKNIPPKKMEEKIINSHSDISKSKEENDLNNVSNTSQEIVGQVEIFDEYFATDDGYKVASKDGVAKTTSEIPRRKKKRRKVSTSSNSSCSESSDSSSSSSSVERRKKSKSSLTVAKKYYHKGKLVKIVKKKKKKSSDSETLSDESSDSDRKRKRRKYKKIIKVIKKKEDIPLMTVTVIHQALKIQIPVDIERKKERVKEATRKKKQKRKHHDFKEGDLVYVDHASKTNRNKLKEIRIGPLKIIKKISNSIFELDTGHRKKESNMFHISKLVPLPQGGGM